MTTNKQIAIDTLTKTLNMLKELKDEEYYHESFVEEFDIKAECGTQCCSLGWYPKYIPESGLIWKRHSDNDFELYDTDDTIISNDIDLYHANGTIHNNICQFHKINTELYHLLFHCLNPDIDPAILPTIYYYVKNNPEIDDSINKYIAGMNRDLKQQIDIVQFVVNTLKDTTVLDEFILKD